MAPKRLAGTRRSRGAYLLPCSCASTRPRGRTCALGRPRSGVLRSSSCSCRVRGVGAGPLLCAERTPKRGVSVRVVGARVSASTRMRLVCARSPSRAWGRAGVAGACPSVACARVVRPARCASCARCVRPRSLDELRGRAFSGGSSCSSSLRSCSSSQLT